MTVLYILDSYREFVYAIDIVTGPTYGYVISVKIKFPHPRVTISIILILFYIFSPIYTLLLSHLKNMTFKDK